MQEANKSECLSFVILYCQLLYLRLGLEWQTYRVGSYLPRKNQSRLIGLQVANKIESSSLASLYSQDWCLKVRPRAHPQILDKCKEAFKDQTIKLIIPEEKKKFIKIETSSSANLLLLIAPIDWFLAAVSRPATFSAKVCFSFSRVWTRAFSCWFSCRTWRRHH
jgi:hypothetical protein